MNQYSRIVVLRALVLGSIASSMVEGVAGRAMTTPYSLIRSAISDLGATTCTTLRYPTGPTPVCSPLHAAMNASMVVSGLLTLAIGILLAPLLPDGRRRTVATMGLVITGVGSILTGLVPVDVDLELHTAVSVPALLVGIPAIALAMTAHRWRRTMLTLAWISTIAGVITVLWVENGVLGLTERVSLYAAAVVLAAVAWQPERRAGLLTYP